MHLLLLLLQLDPMPVRTEEREREPRMPVLAHYCNWLSRNGERNTWGDANTIPLRPEDHGGYDSFDPAILAEQNAEMLRHGIVPLVSWWGPDARSGDEFLDLYLTVPGPRLGLLYEAAGGNGGRLRENRDGWIDFDDPRVSERFIADVNHLHERYWSRPEYADRWFRIDGKPVLFIWISHAFRGRFDRVAAQVRSRVPVYIIGSNFNLTDDPRYDSWFFSGIEHIVRGMDAVSSYGIYHPYLTPRTGGHITEDYVSRYATAWRAWMAWLRVNAPGVKFVPPFGFAYKDSRGNPELTSTYDEATYLGVTIRLLMAESLCKGDPLLMMTLGVSYNEHYEGTSFEPTLQYRDDWLRIIDLLLRPEISPDICPAENPQ